MFSSLTLRHRVVAASVVTVAAAAVLASPLATGSAQAKPKPFVVTFNAEGSTTVAKTGSSIPLGPALLTTKLRGSGDFTGTLPLKPASTSFKALGLVPITATVTFIPVGKITGKLGGGSSATTVTTTATYTVNLSDVKAAGIPMSVGSTCQTAAPVVIPLATPEGQSFNLVTGGTVSGTYTIGNFANCGLTTGLINLLIPGAGNTATLSLTSAS